MSTSSPAFLYRPSSLATIVGIWTILGGDVGMPMVILVCACAAAGSMIAAASTASDGMNFCILLLPGFLLFARKWPVNWGILPHCHCKNNEACRFVPGHTAQPLTAGQRKGKGNPGTINDCCLMPEFVVESGQPTPPAQADGRLDSPSFHRN